jgi:hypothetical protein
MIGDEIMMKSATSRRVSLMLGMGLATSAVSAMLIPATAAHADVTPECNVGAGEGSTECGVDSAATGTGAVAVGNLAVSSGNISVATGQSAVASGLASSAYGSQTIASGTASTALGHNSDATGIASTAVGVSAQATQNFTTAVGQLANAGHVGATAIGARATSTAANQVVLGGAGTHVRIGDIAASTAAQQTSSVGVATVDANGVLGRNTTIMPAISSLQASFASQATAIGTLQNDTVTLFDLADRARGDIREANEGVAMALAMDSPSIPAGAKFALSGGLGYFKNRAAFAAAVSAAVGEMSSVSAGIGYGIKSNEIGARGGFQIAW